MTDEVNAAVDFVQAAAPEPDLDLASGYPSGKQLPSRDGAELPSGQRRDNALSEANS